MASFLKVSFSLAIALIAFFAFYSSTLAQTVTANFGDTTYVVSQNGASSAVVMDTSGPGQRFQAFNLIFLGTTSVPVSGRVSGFGKLVIFYSSGTPNDNCQSFDTLSTCLSSPNYLSQVFVDTPANCYGINSLTCTTFLSATPENVTWGGGGFWGEDFEVTDVRETLTASVQATGGNLWPLLIFSGIALAFIIFLQVVFLTQKSVKPQKRKDFNMVKFDKKADDLMEFYSKTGNAKPEDLEVIRRKK